MALNQAWKLSEMIGYRRWFLPCEITVVFCLPGTSPLKISLSLILTLKWIFCFHNSNTEYYQYTSKAAVIKLTFWVRDRYCYWCVADSRNWRCAIVMEWHTEVCWRGSGHCTNLQICISLWVTGWLPKHCPHFFNDLPWLPWYRWTCHFAAILMMKGWNGY
jgi:hypothetical protein